MKTPDFKQLIKLENLKQASKIKVDRQEAEHLKENAKKKVKKFSFKLHRVIKIVLVVIIILSLFFTSAKMFANVTMSNMTDWVKGIFLNASPGDGYPYEISSESVLQSETVGSYLALVENDKLVYLNSMAKEIFTLEHNFVSPVLKTRNGRALFYCADTTSFIVTSSSEILFDMQDTEDVLPGVIVTGDIGQRGNIAFACWSDECVCQINAYDQKLKREFCYNFSSGRVVDLCLSPDGNYLAAAVIDAKDAALFTRLMIFDLSKSEPVSDQILENQTAVDIEYLSGKNVELLTLTSLYNYNYTFSSSKPEQILDFSSNSLQAYDFDCSSKCFSIAVSEYVSSTSKVYFVKPNGKKYKTLDLNGLKKLQCGNKYTAALTEDAIYCINSNGKIRCEIPLEANVDDVLCSTSKLFAFAGVKIYKVSISHRTKLELN